MCWPCRVVEDSGRLLALFIAGGSKYKAGPKRQAVEKLSMTRVALPPDERVWRNDTLRLMFPERQHSVWLSWVTDGSSRKFSQYFVNMEEPFRRTAVGFDTQDHTLDIEVAPNLTWKWRDTGELQEHVKHGFYTASLASEVWNEGRRVMATDLFPLQSADAFRLEEL
jgi:predicted RNA-binding protein associated with RNAse of E/G family